MVYVEMEVRFFSKTHHDDDRLFDMVRNLYCSEYLQLYNGIMDWRSMSKSYVLIIFCGTVILLSSNSGMQSNMPKWRHVRCS